MANKKQYIAVTHGGWDEAVSSVFDTPEKAIDDLINEFDVKPQDIILYEVLRVGKAILTATWKVV